MISCTKIHLLSSLVIGGFLAFASQVIASTKDSWEDYNIKVMSSCIKASNLNEVASITNTPIEFSDEVGYTAIILKGIYPQPHMRNKKGYELCLFNKKTHETYISEMDGYK